MKHLTEPDSNVSKLPFSIFAEEDDDCTEGSDYIYDNEANESLSLFDGVSQIIDTINCDDRELFNTIDTETTKVFIQLCKQLELE